MSEPFDIHVGVGQGDPLSTLLFDIFIDDLLVSLHTECGGNGVAMSEFVQIVSLAFADDVTCVSHSPEKLQASIDHVAAWLRKWRMDANTVKSKIVAFHPSVEEAAGGSHPNVWTLGGAPITQVESIKYLGVWFTENGSWDLHVQKSLAKMKSALGYWRPLLRCHRLSTKIRVLMLQTFIYNAALYGSEVWSGTQNMLTAFDVIVKSALRSVLGLRRMEVGSDALFIESGLTPPSRIIMVNKLCYHSHVLSLDTSRWSKLALTCSFDGVRTAGRPRAGVNWVGEVQSFTENVCHALNIPDLFQRAADQSPVRRVSTRSNVPVIAVGDEVEAALGSNGESATRKIVLDNIWLWNLGCLKDKYTRIADTEPAWYYDCVASQKRCMAQYLRSLPSLKARLIVSARSGRLGHLHARLNASTEGEVGLADNVCISCQESLGNSKQATSHCMVDCPAVWPKLDKLFSVVNGLHDRGGQFDDLLQSLSGEDLIKAILAPSSDAVPRSVGGKYWAAVADVYCHSVCDSCRDDDGLVMGHGEGGLAIVGTGLDQVSAHTVSSSDSQVALGVVNVHVDTAAV